MLYTVTSQLFNSMLEEWQPVKLCRHWQVQSGQIPPVPKADTPQADNPWADTLQADTPQVDPPQADTPPPFPGDGHCIGRYASYCWNAFLL